MSTPLLNLTVRPDWREITQRVVARDNRMWTAMHFAVVGVAIVAQLLALLFAPWSMAIRAGVFCALFWALPLWWLWRSLGRSSQRLSLRPPDVSRRARRVCLGVAAAVGAAIVAALDVMPRFAQSMSWLGDAAVLLTGAAVLLIGVGAAILLSRYFPHPLRAFGLVSDAWGVNLTIGVALGAALGFHFLIVASVLPSAADGIRSAPALAWFIGFQVGLRVLGEELFFRGLGFHLLTSIGTSNRVLTGWLTLLNLFVYLWLFGPGGDLMSGLLVLYGGLLALVCTRLRLRQESLLPGLACQAVFVLFVAGVIRL